MTFIERATKTAQSVADGAVATVSEVGTAIAEGVVVATDDIRSGIRTGTIRPVTVIAAASVGLIAVLEWPVLVAAGGIALVATKLRKRGTEAPHEDPAPVAEG